MTSLPRGIKVQVAVTVPVLQQACCRHKMWKMKNSFFPCKSSLLGEFYAPSFGFISAGLVTVSPLLTQAVSVYHAKFQSSPFHFKHLLCCVVNCFCDNKTASLT